MQQLFLHWCGHTGNKSAVFGGGVALSDGDDQYQKTVRVQSFISIAFGQFAGIFISFSFFLHYYYNVKRMHKYSLGILPLSFRMFNDNYIKRKLYLLNKEIFFIQI